MRQYSFIDEILIQSDQALRTLVGKASTKTRQSPAKPVEEKDLSQDEKRHAAGLMRINHTGEVCAQALYSGQAFTAKLDTVKTAMETAAEEEEDHLAWTEERISELDSFKSRLNPLFYGLSWTIGATAGAISDKLSLGFVAATEQQVCRHLDDHLTRLPRNDEKSRAILTTMYEDEAHHATTALEAGGYQFPTPVTFTMRQLAKVMTFSTYRF